MKLARSSVNEFEQHNAYTKAVELLTKEESVEVVEVLIEFAEWLHRKGYPTLDVEDQLSLAIDALMDIEPGWDDEDDDQLEEADDGRSKSKRSRGSRASRQSMAKSRMSRMSKKTGRTKRSKRSGRSKRSLRTGVSRSTNRTRKTKTNLSKLEEEDPAP